MQEQLWEPEKELADSAVSLEQMDLLVKWYLDKREAYEEAKKISTEKYHEYEAAEGKIIAALKAAGKKSYKVDGVGIFSLTFKEVVTTPKTAEEKQLVFSWIKDKYGEEVLTNMVSINHATLNSFYNQEAEKAEDRSLFEIPGLAAPTVVESASWRKAAK